MPPAASWWSILAEVAISMGVAGLAGIIARGLGNRLGQHITGAARGGNDLALVIGATDGVKEGLKLAGKKTLLPSSKPGGDDQRAKAATDDEPSSNPKIAFWHKQEMMLADVAGENETLITKAAYRMEPVIGSNPQLAIDAMRSIKDQLIYSRDNHAVEQQALASTAQFISGIARAGLGTEAVPGRSETTTDLRAVREHNPWVKPTGVLRLDVTLPRGVQTLDPKGVTVTSARFDGVSQEIGDRLKKQVLTDVPIPIAMEVGGGDTLTAFAKGTMTRDEAGRVRAHRTTPSETTPSRLDDTLGIESQERTMPDIEAQMIRSASVLFDHVLSKPLSDQGIDELTTDDATGRGDKVP